MEMISVSSSAISHIGYDKNTKQMKITFKGSGTYDYCNVPESAFEAFKMLRQLAHIIASLLKINIIVFKKF